MRLKEPLYGLNISNLHFIFHLGLAFAMIFIETRFDEDRHWPTPDASSPNCWKHNPA